MADPLPTHARTRALERFGVEISKENMKAIRLGISHGSPFVIPIPVFTGDRRVFAVRYHGLWIPFLVGEDGYVITVLPSVRIYRHRMTLKARLKELIAAGTPDGY